MLLFAVVGDSTVRGYRFEFKARFFFATERLTVYIGLYS